MASWMLTFQSPFHPFFVIMRCGFLLTKLKGNTYLNAWFYVGNFCF